MPAFGSFETVQEVYSDPTYTVYTAHQRGDPAGEYAVKSFRLRLSELEAQLAGRNATADELEQALLNSVDVQERAAAGSSFIAPILERGHDEHRVWYATRFYP